MAKPTSRQELAEYCLRNLGGGVLEINVSDDQIDDRIDEALQYYQQFHDDSMIQMYYKHQLTADDVTNTYITIPESFAYVTRIFPFNTSGGASSGMFSAQYQIHLNDIYNMNQSGTIVTYEMARQYLSLIDTKMNGIPGVRHNRHMNRLYIDVEWGKDLQEDDWVIVEAYQIIDPETFADVYNDQWLKRYASALIKRQWGWNLLKFEGMQLPGGVTMNGERILVEAKEEIDSLEEEIRLVWELPPAFMIG